MHKEVLKISLLGLSHGLSDCAAGYMLGTLPQVEGLWDLGALVLLYNVLAFGMQVPAGLLVDRIGRPKAFVALSLGLLALGLGIYSSAPVAGVALAGVAGAFFHSAGGRLAFLAFPGSTVGAGLFAAPGVMGLMLGGYMAWQSVPAVPFLFAGAVLLLLVVAIQQYSEIATPSTKDEEVAGFDWHDAIMLVLLLAIAMRSAVWNLFELIHQEQHALLLGLGLAAMLGKLLGGLLAQRIGWQRYGVAALVLSAPLLLLGGTRPWTMFPGIFLLQSATPVAMAGMWRLLPRLPATAAGMCLGLAIAVGGLPVALGWEPSFWWIAFFLLLAAVGYWLALRRRRERLAA